MGVTPILDNRDDQVTTRPVTEISSTRWIANHTASRLASTRTAKCSAQAGLLVSAQVRDGRTDALIMDDVAAHTLAVNAMYTAIFAVCRPSQSWRDEFTAETPCSYQSFCLR
jgi:hypothetical protein